MTRCTRLIWALLPIHLLFGDASAFAQRARQPDSTSTESQQEKVRRIELRERFGEQQFRPSSGFLLRVGQRLPGLKWQHPEWVATVVDHSSIPTRWFNEQFDRVDFAERPGRYFVYGEAPTPDGRPLRRAMTCCCLRRDANIEEIARDWISLSQTDVDPRNEAVKAVVRRWQTTEEGAVELAAFLDAERRATASRIGQWQMENATRHVRLKRKLMGLDRKPTVKATVRRLTGDPAPVLHEGSLSEASVSKVRVAGLERKLDEWHDDSGEPMAIVIARNGVIVLAKGFGSLDGRPVTVDTPMLLHSAMKPLLGIQLAMYVDQGIVQLDEPMGNYLPDFSTPRDRNLTFRAGHVHVTGIHFPWELAFSRLFYFHTWHESLIAHCKREWEPGARHRYGVVGIILSVRALELLRGRNYWDAMERDLFAPLGIENVLPGGTGFSAESLARVAVLLDNRGKYGEWEVISEPTYEAILPTSLKPYFPETNLTYGIGLRDASSRLGAGSYGHGGGCGTQLIVNPRKHLVVAMVRNDRGKNYDQHFSEMMTLLRKWIEQ